MTDETTNDLDRLSAAAPDPAKVEMIERALMQSDVLERPEIRQRINVIALAAAIPDDHYAGLYAERCGQLAMEQAKVADLEAERDALREENKKLRQSFAPQWFYADGYSSEECRDSPDEVLEGLDLKPGKHVVQVDVASPLPSIWLAVHVRTDEEMDAEETDDRETFTEHASEAEARKALERGQ